MTENQIPKTQMEPYCNEGNPEAAASHRDSRGLETLSRPLSQAWKHYGIRLDNVAVSLMENLLPIAQIIFADIILSGDNALVIGMAAATLSLHFHRKAIFLGMALAAGLRIFFAVI